MTLGEWLNQVILEDGPLPEDEAPVRYPAFGRVQPNPPASQPAPQRRYETPSHPGDEIIGVTEALDRLGARIEAAEHRTTLAISGVEQSVAGVASRLEASEREQIAVAARFEGVAEDLRIEQSRVGQKLIRLEEDAEAPPAVEALRSMEAALAKVASHLYEGETQTRDTFNNLRQEFDGVHERLEAADGRAGEAIDAAVGRLAERLELAESRTAEALRDLHGSLGDLDQRLHTAETRMEGRASDVGLEQLAANLSARVDAARAEMAEKIRESADGRFDRMERTLQEMTGHVQAAERRSAHAVERMGHEVLRMADTLARKVQDVEHRSADAIEQVGGEVARIADAMETRLGRTDAVGAQALEKLGAEIARITERLAERIADAERRSAQAFDDVGDQVSRVSDRLQDRQEKVSSELAERIRQSEERTAKLLEDARERIDQRLAETQRRAAEPQRSQGYAAYDDPMVGPFGQDGFARTDQTFLEPDVEPFGGGSPRTAVPEDLFAPALPAADPFDEPALIAEPSAVEPEPAFSDPAFYEIETFDDPDSLAASVALAEAMPSLEDATVDEGLVEAPDAPTEPMFATADLDDAVEAEAAVPPRNFTTRELVEQARAAARATQSPDGKSRSSGGEAGGSMFSGLGFGQKKAKRRGGSSLQTALVVSGATAALGVAVAGYVILAGRPGGVLPERVAEALGQKSTPARPAVGETPMAAVALSPTPLASADQSGAMTPPAAPTAANGASDAYADAVRRIETHDFSGVDQLRKAANLGYAPAEFYLAKLYETGEAGVKKDAVQARVWTQRAADAGDPKAMHNLALYFFEGDGGPKNTTSAAQWFRRAADLGLVDSQFNLGRLYEDGFGVSQNPAEAYKWYLIAAKSGDAESRMSALRLKGQLSAEAQAAAERAAQGFEAQAPGLGGQLAQATGPGADDGMALAQRALSRLGYYQGPADGVSSPALKFAIAAYQRDQGLPATGALDPTVVDKLNGVAP
jgi:localization factor PodJL